MKIISKLKLFFAALCAAFLAFSVFAFSACGSDDENGGSAGQTSGSSGGNQGSQQAPDNDDSDSDNDDGDEHFTDVPSNLISAALYEYLGRAMASNDATATVNCDYTQTVTSNQPYADSYFESTSEITVGYLNAASGLFGDSVRTGHITTGRTANDANAQTQTYSALIYLRDDKLGYIGKFPSGYPYYQLVKGNPENLAEEFWAKETAPDTDEAGRRPQRSAINQTVQAMAVFALREEESDEEWLDSLNTSLYVLLPNAIPISAEAFDVTINCRKSETAIKGEMTLSASQENRFGFTETVNLNISFGLDFEAGNKAEDFDKNAPSLDGIPLTYLDIYDDYSSLPDKIKAGDDITFKMVCNGDIDFNPDEMSPDELPIGYICLFGAYDGKKLSGVGNPTIRLVNDNFVIGDNGSILFLSDEFTLSGYAGEIADWLIYNGYIADESEYDPSALEIASLTLCSVNLNTHSSENRYENQCEAWAYLSF